MSVVPFNPVNGQTPLRWEWGQNYLWVLLSNYYWKGGEKTHIAHLPGGTPWRFPTSYVLDIYNIKEFEHIRTSYPDGASWDGLPFGSTSDIFYLMNADGWSPGNSAHPNFDQNLWNEACTIALGNIADQKVDVGSNIGEGKQALKMLAQPCMDVWQAMKAFKRGQFRKTADLLRMNWRQVINGKYAADSWLAYQFGWKPLLSDAHDAYQEFQKASNGDLIVSGKGFSKAQRSGSPSVPDTNFTGNYTVDERAFCRLDAYVTCPETRNANQWNTINPLSVAWELMPWSFAIDWFVPIGNTLETLTASTGLSFLSGSVTQVRETKQETRFSASGGYTIVTDGHVKIEKFQMRRNPLYVFPDPYFYAKTKNPFSSTHTANALALWRQIPPLR